MKCKSKYVEYAVKNAKNCEDLICKWLMVFHILKDIVLEYLFKQFFYAYQHKITIL